MPRSARKESQSGIYHIVLRGINRQQIFEDDEDYEKFLQVLMDCKRLSGFRCYAYCLMGNHIHLLLQSGREPFGQVFRRIGARYVYWYNWKYGRNGHLFQDRYKSMAVENDAYMLSALRYIHQNPMKAGLTKDINSYKWSSAMAYLMGGNSLVDARCVLLLFSENPTEQIETYTEYMQGHDDIGHLEGESVKRLNDKEAREAMKLICGVSTVVGFQAIPSDKRGAVLKEMHKQGISIRQIARLTGISVGFVRKEL